MSFDPYILWPEHLALARQIVPGEGQGLREPDFCIAPDGVPYLWRWHVVPRNEHANVYFHIQVTDDPERPLHDHPWDNTSVILAGGYDEQVHRWGDPHSGYAPLPPATRKVREGDVIHRKAEEAHRWLRQPSGNQKPHSRRFGPVETRVMV